MATPVEIPVATPAWHRMLLRLAGWGPDGLVAAARTQLARGRTRDVAEMVGYGALATRIPMLGEDIDLLSDLLGRPGPADPATPSRRRLAGLVRVTRLGLPRVAFTAEHPDHPPSSANKPDGPISFSNPDGEPDGEFDEIDAAALDAVERDSDGTVQGVWRCWRSPDLATAWPPPRRVFLVQASDGAGLALLAARRQEMLEHAGEATPQVEVFTDPDQLPPYQRAALAASTLLWSRRGTSALPVAPVFDPVAPAGGPGFTGTRANLAEAERGPILSYLEDAAAVLASTAQLDDVLDRTAHAVVPAGFRSDGRWVWSEATAYYLRRHGIAPDPALLEHIRAAGSPAPLDAVGAHRALAGLREAARPVAVFTPPGPVTTTAAGTKGSGAAAVDRTVTGAGLSAGVGPALGRGEP